MKILRNYILKELLGPFVLSLLVFTFILLMGNLVKFANMVIAKGVETKVAFLMFVNLIPYLLSYTLPMSCLSAILLGIGRLSCDGELTTMKASGLNLARLVLPLGMVGIILSLILFTLNDKILPSSHFASRKLLHQLGLRKPSALLEEGTFIRGFQNYILFIYEIEKDKLKNIRIYEPRPGKPTRTIVAKEGRLIASADGKLLRLKLIDGTSDEPNPKDPTSFYKLNFKTYYITLRPSTGRSSKSIGKKSKDMDLDELKRQIRKLKALKIDVSPLLTELNKRISLAFSPIVFVLVGFPIAVMIHRKEKPIGFGLSLIVILAYYLLMLFFEALSTRGTVSPQIGMWLPNILVGFAGLILIYRVCAH